MTSTGTRRNSWSASVRRLRARSGRPGLKQQKASFPRPIKRTRPTRSGEATRQCRPGTFGWTSTTRVDRSDYYAPYGYNVGFAVVQLLRQCGDNLTRENIMKQASHLDMELPLLLPGIRLKTSSTDLRPIKQMRLVRFDGERYVLFSDVLASE